MEFLKDQTIGQIVAADYRTAQVFENFGLDFCCGGNKTIEEAAWKNKVDPQKIKNALQDLGDEEAPTKYNQWALDFLADYIVNTHHQFTRDKLPEIDGYLQKVAKVHGNEYKELYEIYRVFTVLYTDLTDHLAKEEEILFPYIKKLVDTEKNCKNISDENFGTGAEPVAMMEGEHEEAGAAMSRIRRLSNGFIPPEDACTTYHVLYKNLEGFEKDLQKHVHLENNILFPKALKMEQELNAI